jgi:Tfp pilus assembly major pilin PilA
VKFIGTTLIHHSSCYCPCGTLLYEHQYYSDDDATTATAESIRTKAGVKEELKSLRVKRTNEVKAHAAFRKLVKEESAKLDETIKPHVEVINLEKTATVNTLKQSDEYRAYKSAKASVSNSYNRFMKKHEVQWKTMRHLVPQRKWHWRSPVSEMNRELRIRL